MSVCIGTSRWVYKHWREVFYPKALPQRAWFAYYAREFYTVEINNSFYRLPEAKTFDAWCQQAPEHFVYAVKASRYLTHMKKLKDPEEPLETFFERARHLKNTLGPVLYQLPPHWHLDLPRFEHFLRALPKGYTHVVEFRDASWLVENVFERMEEYGVAHCIHDMPPLKIPRRVTSSTVYLRFHGNADHHGYYSRAELEKWAVQIQTWHREKSAVYAYFNNAPNGYAIQNARTLKELVQRTN